MEGHGYRRFIHLRVHKSVWILKLYNSQFVAWDICMKHLSFSCYPHGRKGVDAHVLNRADCCLLVTALFDQLNTTSLLEAAWYAKDYQTKRNLHVHIYMFQEHKEVSHSTKSPWLSPPYSHTANDQILEMGTAWERGYTYSKNNIKHVLLITGKKPNMPHSTCSHVTQQVPLMFQEHESNTSSDCGLCTWHEAGC